ncbi:hypothetical protein [Flavonifractor sp. An100]|uniref:hypothetical protein n=1 Tax=Flavonifractor sp. An100 TaxID=1965538 RepID=UPI000B372F0A|nr:hypothetical protein [Flavonifractor sp. An100]OUQ78715.1 hypothetical protein B5E43_07250 [Flavonifractor sp. An100]
MNMPLIAAAAMAGGALLGFSLCWAATRLAGGSHAAAARLATAAKKKMGTMDKVLILEGVILVAYTAADLAVFWHTGNEPATLTACVFGVCGFENGVMGWIKTTKEKQAAARTSGSGQTAAPEEPPKERPEPPDVGI